MQKIQSETGHISIFRYEQKGQIMYCGYHRLSDDLFHDFCMVPVNKEKPQPALSYAENSTISNEKLPSAFSRQQSLFNSNKLKLPQGFHIIKATERRTYVIDSSGLLENEIYYEPGKKIFDTEAGRSIYEQTVQKILAEQGGWHFKNRIKDKNSVCLQFSGSEKTAVMSKNKSKGAMAHFCYTSLDSSPSGTGGHTRLVFLSTFASEYIDHRELSRFQLNLLNQWNSAEEK